MLVAAGPDSQRSDRQEQVTGDRRRPGPGGDRDDRRGPTPSLTHSTDHCAQTEGIPDMTEKQALDRSPTGLLIGGQRRESGDGSTIEVGAARRDVVS
jgi:hypothetical protein